MLETLYRGLAFCVLPSNLTQTTGAIVFGQAIPEVHYCPDLLDRQICRAEPRSHSATSYHLIIFDLKVSLSLLSLRHGVLALSIRWSFASRVCSWHCEDWDWYIIEETILPPGIKFNY